MSPEQRELARHALGLPNERNHTYRNRYVTFGSHPYWEAMVAAGEAKAHITYSLTDAGATAALDPEEKLDSEDFPS